MSYGIYRKTVFHRELIILGNCICPARQPLGKEKKFGVFSVIRPNGSLSSGAQYFSQRPGGYWITFRAVESGLSVHQLEMA